MIHYNETFVTNIFSLILGHELTLYGLTSPVDNYKLEMGHLLVTVDKLGTGSNYFKQSTFERDVLLIFYSKGIS